jgi:hypothetical protein
MSAPIRVAILARVVYPLHGYGGIERHVYHLTTHLARLGVDITLYVQQSDDAAGLAHLRTQMQVETMRYDYTSPILRPNSIVGRQINYPRYTLAQGARVALSPISGASLHPLCRQTPVIDQLAKALVNLARSRCVGHALFQR